MICCLAPTIGISRYINRLLQPIYDQAANLTTFFKESNAVHALENYDEQGLLRSNTLFATLHVNSLCTVVPHEQSIEALSYNVFSMNMYQIEKFKVLLLLLLFNLVVSFYKINILYSTTKCIDKLKVVVLVYH
jgi:hypothetical protein